MKRCCLILCILILRSVVELPAQDQQLKGYWHQEWVEIDGERMPNIHILPVYVYDKGIDRRRHQRLIKAVKKVYPLARLAREMLGEMEDELAMMDTKKEQSEHVKGIYKAVIEEYTPVLKTMTRSEGKVFLKLIARETEYTAYNILYEFRGQFLAGFWQGVSRVFGQNLKSEFGQEDEDIIIEQIIIYYEAGLL